MLFCFWVYVSRMSGCDACGETLLSTEGVLCGIPGCATEYCSQECAGHAWATTESKRHTLRDAVLTRLNAYNDAEQTVRAVRALEAAYFGDRALDGGGVAIVFHHCDEWPKERKQTAKANGERIMICDDIRTEAFQRERISFPLPPGLEGKVTHYAAVVLHEFGHVLQKHGYLDDMVVDTQFVPDKELPERQADWWVYSFLK